MEKSVLPATWLQRLNSGDPSPADGSSTTKAFAYAENIEKNIDRNLTSCAYNAVEGKINKQTIISQQEDGASEAASCRKARVSIRAPSDFSLVWIISIIYHFMHLVNLLVKMKYIYIYIIEENYIHD